MDTSTFISSTQASIPGPDGLHIATLYTTHLDIRKTTTLDLVRSIDLPVRRSKFVCLRWSRPSSDFDPSEYPPNNATHPALISTRILLATTDSVLVFSLTNPAFRATISNGSGGLGPISHADFGCDDAEVMIWTSMGASVCVWSLDTGRMVAELKDPKFFGSAGAIVKGCGWSRDGQAESAGSGSDRGVFALLTRPGAQDIITLYAGKEFTVIKSWTCDTLDAQGIKWSPDGRWLALWDAASMGYKVQVYTADGHCFRTYNGDYFNDELKGLGVKRVEWEPNGMWLALASWEQGITLLDTRKIIPAMRITHPRIITPSSTLSIYQENATSTSQRSYQELTNPTSPPTASPAASTSSIASTTPSTSTTTDISKTIPQGTSLLSFSPSGDLLATKDDSMPTAVYIWAFSGSLSLRAVLLHHAIVTKLAWAHSRGQYGNTSGEASAERLLITCETQAQMSSQTQAQSQSQPRHIHLYDAGANQAHILTVPTSTANSTTSMGPRVDASWLPHSRALMLGGQQGYMLVWPDGREMARSAEEPESELQEGERQYGLEPGQRKEEEDNSVFDITTGLQAAELGEDTFHNKRVAGVMA